MDITKWNFLSALLLILLICPIAQTRDILPRRAERIVASPDEIISMSSSMPFNRAVVILNGFSKRYLNKIIVDQTDVSGPIGVSINRMYWRDAFDLIVMEKGLQYEEFSDYILIKGVEDMPTDDEYDNIEVDNIDLERLISTKLFETREVIVSAIFFEANVSKIRQIGSSIFFSNNDSTSTVQMGAGETEGSLLQINGFQDLDFGNLLFVFNALESNQAGEVIACPQITVRSNSAGRIQIGSDFSVSTKDFSGNTVTQFFSTGTIIDVTPEIIELDSVTFISLELDVQKSTTVSSELGIEVKKSSATTSILLLDGEETMIGGLYSKDNSGSRDGVPILKDLPWWFFGLRYLFGSDNENWISKELIIIIRAELVPTLAERINDRLNGVESQDSLKSIIQRYREGLLDNDIPLDETSP